jgi:hypothetical protein
MSFLQYFALFSANLATNGLPSCVFVVFLANNQVAGQNV